MKSLFEKNNIAGIDLKNRMIRSALWMNMADKDGHITPKLYDVYRELAEGGVGMIFTGYAMVDENDRPNPGMIGIYNDSFVEEHKKLVDIAHENNTAIALQVAYGGSQSFHPDRDQWTLFGPSAVENRVTKITPKAMTREDIKHLVTRFADAAVRAQIAGYDAVELHAAHGYLLSQFLTPYCNHRTDEYGGSLENRARIICEVVQTIKEKTNGLFPVFVKMNHHDYMDEGEGIVVSDAVQVAQLLEKAGVDLIEISGTNETSGKGVGPARTKIAKPEKQSYYLEPTKEIAKVVSIPVVLMGGNRDAKRLQSILNEGEIEYFSIARPLLCEPSIINQWKRDVNYKPKCVSCNGCYRDGEVGCVIRELLAKKNN